MKLQSQVTAFQLDTLIEYAEPLVVAAGDGQAGNTALETFVITVHASGFVQPYDWIADDAARRDQIRDPAALFSMDLDTFRRTVIVHVRADRFCEGHLLSLARSGYLTAVIKRAGELRATL
jgi:hypothetical protein